MAVEIKMPQLSDTMQNAKILHWHKSEGDIVKRGDSLAEVETDKANLDVEAFHEGVLLKIFVQTNEIAKVGDIIAVIGQAGENYEITHKHQEPAFDAQEPLSTENILSSRISPDPQALAQELDKSRIKASPLARRLAEERHIDLRSIEGSGPDGRIIKRDLEGALLKHQTAESSVSIGRSSAPSAALSGRTLPLSKMRETIGQRMQQSVRESPHFFVTVAINMEESLKLLQQLKEDPHYGGINITHLIIKAAAYALQREPQVNSSIRNGEIFRPDTINIGIITAVRDGLLIPVVKNAGRVSLQSLVAETRAVIERARNGKSNSSDLSGGTFSISNLGMYDVESFTAIISPGQGAVLAIGSIKEEAVVENSSLSAAAIMRVTLSSDHRVIDGVRAAGFLRYFKEALQNPELLFIQEDKRA